MPIYEYRCKKGHTFDVMQRMADDALDTCEVCGAPAVRVLHAPAVHFKGSGFYNTDYGTKRRNRELRESAESGADRYEAGQAEKKKEAREARDAKSSSSSSDSRAAAKSSGDGRKPAARKPAKKS